mgnify:CR=1 FL=1
MVPNSLGPAELLQHYGTEYQQKYFLPKLSDGTFIPCFGLTGPNNGSDAVGEIDEGIVEKINEDTGEILSLYDAHDFSADSHDLKMKEGNWLILARDRYRLDKLEEDLKIYLSKIPFSDFKVFDKILCNQALIILNHLIKMICS